jgi:hypothetical protein
MEVVSTGDKCGVNSKKNPSRRHRRGDVLKGILRALCCFSSSEREWATLHATVCILFIIVTQEQQEQAM